MPSTNVYFFRESDGHSPVVEWLRELRASDEDAYAKCIAVITRLRESGHELRRPTADLLRNGIYELRARKGHVNYRLLYFFHGRHVAIVAHGITKESDVPAADIARALRRKRLFETSPELHTFSLEE